MKRITTILLVAILLVSCSKDGDDIINAELEGNWTLTNAYCFCAFDSNTDFSVHKITFKGSILTVDNSGEPQFLSDATGNYVVTGNLITLKNGVQFRFTIKESLLTLIKVDNPDIADDELTLEYAPNLPM